MTMTYDPSEIIVGDRHRQNIDDGIHELAQSIRELGQLQPILISDDGTLIAGHRRLRACEHLGIRVKAVVATDLNDAMRRLKAERDENTCRKPFLPSEAVALGKAIEALEAPKAAERKAATQAKPGNDGKQPAGTGSGKLPEPVKGDTRDKVAEAIGMSGRTYEKAKVVIEAASAPDAPEPVKQAAAEMDRTGKVDPAFKAVKAERDSAPKPGWPTLLASIRKRVFEFADANPSVRGIIAQHLMQLSKEVGQ